MEYIEELTLIKLTPTQDENYQIYNTETRRTILVRRNVVGSREFYNAMAVGIRPTAELQIRVCDYDNEQEVEYKGQRYSIIRTIPKGKFDIVLVIGIKEGVNG